MAQKRQARIIAGVFITGGMLFATGCSAGGDESSNDTLVVWSYYTAGGQLDALDQQNELWSDAHPDIEIEHVQIPFDQLPSRLLATASTQDGPDVVLDNVVVDFPSLAAGGVLADLTEYWDGYADKDQFGGASTWVFSDDKIYNVMSYTNLLGLYYNQDILDEVGVEVPTNLEEFSAAMETVAADGTYTPLAMSGAATVEGAWMFMPLILNNGGGYCSFEGDSVETGFETLNDWARSGYIPADTATWDQADAWQSFMSGNYAFGINGNWNLGDVANADFSIGTTRYPAGPEGSFVYPGGEGIGIGAFSDKKDLAWEYIETAWMSEEASLINFAASGQIPTRSTVAEADEVASNELVQPFIEAAGEAAAWPVNEETAAIQNAVGAASSGLSSGQFSTSEAIDNAITDVNAALELGGGGC